MKMILRIDDEVVVNEQHDDYCCEKMKQVFLSGNFDLFYEKQFARTLCKRRDGISCCWYWDYCPFCGKSIKDKTNEYKKVLKNEFNINDPWDDGIELPEEFHTDEWWKKRGL